MRIQLVHSFEKIAGTENILEAWKEFIKGKHAKPDVEEFQLRLMDNILQLHKDLISGAYKHGPYKAFNINDPKPRSIRKATVRDRLLHHAICRILYPFFDKTFISDSFSCRLNKGTHAAINRFRRFFYIVGRNNARTCWVLKCDIKKFFASINHCILAEILQLYIRDARIIGLLQEVIGSFYSTAPGIGLPLGNLTSQFFVNIYMNEFDQFVKHELKAKYYVRYTDDFVILSENRERLKTLIPLIKDFLKDRLGLELHPEKVFIKTLASGVDFLGWVNFSDHRILRTATKRKMIRRIEANPTPTTINSYVGLLSHGNTYKLRNGILEGL